MRYALVGVIVCIVVMLAVVTNGASAEPVLVPRAGAGRPERQASPSRGELRGRLDRCAAKILRTALSGPRPPHPRHLHLHRPPPTAATRLRRPGDPVRRVLDPSGARSRSGRAGNRDQPWPPTARSRSLPGPTAGTDGGHRLRRAGYARRQDSRSSGDSDLEGRENRAIRASRSAGQNYLVVWEDAPGPARLVPTLRG